MKKVKIIMMSVAIVFAVGAAMATKTAPPCASLPQFYKSGDKFYPAGIEGWDYECQWGHFSVCTWYFDQTTQSYRECKSGKIVWIR